MSKRPRRVWPLLLLTLVGFLVAGTFVLVVLSRRPAEVGLVDGALRPCPSTPNCVCSTDPDVEHAIDAIQLGDDPAAAFEALVALVRDTPGARIVSAEPAYAHAVFQTPMLRFEDDLELLLDEDAGVAHVRSASRVGRSDLGANRKRVEDLRARFGAR